MNRIRFRLSLLALVLWLTVPPAVRAEQFVSLQTRDKVSQGFLWLPAPKAQATVLLFAGGSGVLELSESGLGSMTNNFLVRTRRLFVEQDMNVIVIDAPSDRQDFRGMESWRDGKQHAKDMATVIAWAREKNKVPVWAVGTSRGTLSAAGIAARLLPPQGPDGIVLSATVTGSGGRRPASVYDAKLKRIEVPVLLVHHTQDECFVTEFHGAKRLRKKFKRSPKVDFIPFSGGASDESGPCKALSAHGFIGLEEKVVRAITDWIKNSVP